VRSASVLPAAPSKASRRAAASPSAAGVSGSTATICCITKAWLIIWSSSAPAVAGSLPSRADITWSTACIRARRSLCKASPSTRATRPASASVPASGAANAVGAGGASELAALRASEFAAGLPAVGAATSACGAAAEAAERSSRRTGGGCAVLRTASSKATTNTSARMGTPTKNRERLRILNQRPRLGNSPAFQKHSDAICTIS
jgi:hypothetical protein